MGDDKLNKPVLNIDAQKDFNPASSNGPAAAMSDGLSAAKIKDYLKDIDFKKILEEIPLKKMRRDPLDHDYEKILPAMDMSGSMGSILHELPHADSYKIYKNKEILENKYADKAFDKKIIIFDEMTDTGKKSFSDYYNQLAAVLEGYQSSQACGEALAETCHAGVAQPVAVRRPLSFRPRASA